MADNASFSLTFTLVAATPANLKTALLAGGYLGDPGLKELTISNNGAATIFKGGATPTAGQPILSGSSETWRASGPADLIQSAAIWLQCASGQDVSVDVRGL